MLLTLRGSFFDIRLFLTEPYPIFRAKPAGQFFLHSVVVVTRDVTRVPARLQVAGAQGGGRHRRLQRWELIERAHSPQQGGNLHRSKPKVSHRQGGGVRLAREEMMDRMRGSPTLGAEVTAR